MSEFCVTTRNFRAGTDWFRLNKNRKGKHDLSHCLDQINLDRYIIYKSTRSFRKVSVNSLYQLEYSGYLFFDKNKYNINDINRWMEVVNDIGVRFLSKPFPSIKYIDKIKIIQ